MKRRFGIFILAAFLTASLAVPPGAAFGASEPDGIDPGLGATVAGLSDEFTYEEPLGPGPGDPGDSGDPGDPGDGPEAGEPAGDPGVTDEGLQDTEGGETGAIDEEEADLSALEEIEELTVEPGPGLAYNGFIVVVKPEEVTDEMIEAAPSDPIADSFFVVEEPEEALEFAEPDQIEIIEPNYTMRALGFPDTAPNDPEYKDYQWYLNDPYGYCDVGAEGMWARGLNGTGVRVAVLDTGVNASHQDFGPIATGYNFTNLNGDYCGPNVSDGHSSGHGTMVSSIIAAKANNGLNIAGLAYGAEIVPFKVLKDNGEGDLSDMMAAMNYIALNNDELNIGVVNMSLGAPLSAPSPSLQTVVDNLLALGIIIVAAVGNGYEKTTGVWNYTDPMYPAACNGVVGVASVGRYGNQSSFSQRNSSVDVAAPGESIRGLHNKDNTGTRSGNGTSFASPIVAAVAAAVKQADPDAGYDEFMALLEKTSKRLPIGTTAKNINYGFGLLQADKIAEEFNHCYSVRYLYDGVEDKDLTERFVFTAIKPYAPAPSILTNAREGYKFSGFYLKGKAITADEFPAEVADGDSVDVCYVSQGLSYDDGHWYYDSFDNEGSLTTGWEWYAEEGGYRYFDPEDGGRMAMGLVNAYGLTDTEFEHEKRKCYFDVATGLVKTGIVRVGSYDYYFNGADGMVTDDEIIVVKSTGLLTAVEDPPNTAVYRIDENGRCASGWFPDSDGKRYYDKDGRAEGAKKIGSYFYYFDPEKKGLLRVAPGMILNPLNGKYYYCYSAKGYLRMGNFSAKLNAAADVGKPWYKTTATTFFANKTTAELAYGQVKVGSYFYWYDGPQGLQKNLEREVDETYRWYGSDGKRKNGWVTFTTDALADRTEGRHAKGDKVYYDSKKGLLMEGAQKIGSYWYFLTPWKYGAMWTAVGEIPGYDHYCYSAKGYLRVGGEQTKDGVKYYYDKKGLLAQGPHKVGSYIFFYEDGRKYLPDESDWREDSGNWYYVTAPLGRLKTGKFTAPWSAKIGDGAPDEFTQLYLNTATGAVLEGRVKIGSYHYYYEGKYGLVTDTGWVYTMKGKVPEKTHYVTGANGRLKTGELKVQEGWLMKNYYFAPGNAEAFTGQVKIGSYFYYYDGKYGRVYGEEREVPYKKIDRTHFYRDGDGRRMTGWVTHSGPVAGYHDAGDRVYYHSSNGLLKGKNKIGNFWYWFDQDTGHLNTKVGTKEEPFIADTNTVTGVTSYYYCYSAKGYLKQNGWVKDLAVRDKYGNERKSTFYFNKNAVRLVGPQKIGSYRFFFDRLTGELVKSDAYYLDRDTGTVMKLDGKTPLWIRDGANRYCTNRTDGRLLTGAKNVGGKQYFFEASGLLCVNGEKKVSGKWYFFDADGERFMDSWLHMPDGRLVFFGGDGARFSGVKKIAVRNQSGAVFFDASDKKYEFWYCFDAKTGNKREGFIAVSGKTYYFDPNSPVAGDVPAGKGGAVAKVIPGARAYGERDANGVLIYLNPSTGVLLTGMATVSGYSYYYNGKKGKLYGAEKKIGNYTYYFRAADEEAGYSYVGGTKTVNTGFLASPVTGPPGSRVTGWWKMPAKHGGDLKYFSNEAGKEGRMLLGRQLLPKHYNASFAANDKAYFFLNASTGLIRRNASGMSNGYAWITNNNGELMSWDFVGNTLKGVDVSYWQGTSINWKQVHDSGVKVAICRAGYNGRAGNTTFYPDSTFKRNIAEARKNGIYVGAYIYVYSCRTSDLNAAIDQFAAWMKSQGMGPGTLSLPVFLDIEDSENLSTTGGYSNLTNAARAGMQRLEKHGYKAGFYANLNWANNYFNAQQLYNEGYGFWLASWGANKAEQNSATAAWNGSYPSVWQYRSTGSVPGISGNVDMNYIYSGRVKWT